MIFINEQPIHVAIRTEQSALFDLKGNRIAGKQRRLYAKFKRGEAPDYARAIGEAEYGWLQRPPEVPAGQWLAAYDSLAGQAQNGWTDEEREFIEQTLTDRGYLRVERPKLPAPYPMYDKHRKTVGKRTVDHAIADIVGAYESAGFDIDVAYAYEAENENDPQVLAALKALQPATEDAGTVDEEQVIAA